MYFFSDTPELLVVMSERKDGSMKVFEKRSVNEKNRQSFFCGIDVSSQNVFSAEIVHGNCVVTVSNSDQRFVRDADGIITKEKNIFLSVTVADCIPVYLYDPRKSIVGIMHCGWRSIVGGIVENGLNEVKRIGGKIGNVRIIFGPGICSQHFTVKEDVLENFLAYHRNMFFAHRSISIDLKGIMREQLIDLGVRSENIEDCGICTVESEKFFSYRRDKPSVIEAMIAGIGFR